MPPGMMQSPFMMAAGQMPQDMTPEQQIMYNQQLMYM